MPDELKDRKSVFETNLAALVESFPTVEIDRARIRDMATLLVNPEGFRKVMEKLAGWNEIPMNYLRCITAVDRLTHIEVVYILMNLPGGEEIGVIARCPREGGVLKSIQDVWRSADYQEREVFDLFGVKFDGHPDLRRILMSEEIKGHPLLKDYPKGGDPDDLRAMDAHLPEGWMEKMEEERKKLKVWLAAEIEKIKSGDTGKPAKPKE